MTGTVKVTIGWVGGGVCLTTPPVKQLLHNKLWKADTLLSARNKSAFIQQDPGTLNSQEPKSLFQTGGVAVLF